MSRVRGLSGHLLGRSRLTALAHARDLIHLATALEEAFGSASTVVPGASAEQLELAARRAAALYLRVIARWCGKRAAYLAPLFLHEDRRSIRALLRGAIAGSPAGERLADLIPTPALSEKALEELARQSSARGVVGLLALWGHPLGTPLRDEVRLPQPDPLRLDLILNSEYARQATRAVRRAPLGDSVRRDLTALVRHTVDLENVATALQLAGRPASDDASAFFIPVGKQLDRATFLAAAAADVSSARSLLEHALRNSSLAPVFTARGASFEDAALRAELRRTADAARRSPLGAAPLIQFLTRLRAQLRDLRYIIWRIALGAPPALPDALVTAA